MQLYDREFERLQAVLAEADEPMTAREILMHLDERADIDNPHRVATVLGRWAQRGEVDVISDSPYRYQLNN